MKKTSVLLIILSLCFSLFSTDITAVTENGENVVLHDDGSWEYTSSSFCGGLNGKWEMSEEVMDTLIDELLKESGISADSPTYSFYRGYMRDLIMQQLSSSDINGLITLSLKVDGSCTVSSGEDSIEGTYKLSPERVLTLTLAGKTFTFGTFDEDYSTLSIKDEKILLLKRSE